LKQEEEERRQRYALKRMYYDAAATKVQAGWRGYQDRKISTKLRKQLMDLIEKKAIVMQSIARAQLGYANIWEDIEYLEIENAIIYVQSCMRTTRSVLLTRAQLARRQYVANIMQNQLRTKKARVEFIGMKQIHKHARKALRVAEFRRAQVAVKDLQKMVIAANGQSRFEQQTIATDIVGRFLHYVNDNIRFLRAMQNRNTNEEEQRAQDLEQEEAATRIQCLIRRVLALKLTSALVDEEIAHREAENAKIEQEEFEELAVTHIQSAMRSFLARKKAAIMAADIAERRSVGGSEVDEDDLHHSSRNSVASHRVRDTMNTLGQDDSAEATPLQHTNAAFDRAFDEEESALNLQCLAQTKLTMLEFQSFTDSAMKIQLFSKQMASRKIADQKRAERDMAIEMQIEEDDNAELKKLGQMDAVSLSKIASEQYTAEIAVATIRDIIRIAASKRIVEKQRLKLAEAD